MVNDEVDVGVALRHTPDIRTAPVLLGKARKQESLVNADVAHTKRPRPLDERDADHGVIELPADALRAPLGVALPGLDWVAGGYVFHEPERLDRGRVGHHHGVKEEAPGTLHALDKSAYALGFLERERIALREFRHKREDSEIGVAVHEHVLDELFGRK